MYNIMHPPNQHSGGQHICQKRRRAYVIVSLATIRKSSEKWPWSLGGGNERIITRSNVT